MDCGRSKKTARKKIQSRHRRCLVKYGPVSIPVLCSVYCSTSTEALQQSGTFSSPRPFLLFSFSLFLFTSLTFLSVFSPGCSEKTHLLITRETRNIPRRFRSVIPCRFRFFSICTESLGIASPASTPAATSHSNFQPQQLCPTATPSSPRTALCNWPLPLEPSVLVNRPKRIPVQHSIPTPENR